jgi:hypothetical protein
VKRSSSRVLRLLGVLAVIGTVVVGTGAAPAFAAQTHKPQTHKPHKKLTADEIIGKAIADLESASSVRLYARESVDGITLTIADAYAAHGCLATVTTSIMGTSVSENVLIIGTSEWIQPNNEFWEELGYTGTQLASLEGKWVTPAAFENLFGIKLKGAPPHVAACDVRNAGDGIPARGWSMRKSVKISGDWAWRLGNTETVQVCIEIKRTSCKAAKIPTSAYVSDTGKPEFLRFSVLGITEFFSDYDAPVTIAAPPTADVLTSIPPPPGFGAPTRSGPLAVLASMAH